ncbi:hypothetical protein KOW79_008147 [Hemibagrus wyckioides]|uniref:Uncharacterized protein n=1 Tax=Hemibagrus wyckioides TaxID=337641 RepID=A0A9D3SQV9_9TELE|nr:hypothetical protein KOW79_008147 [Hemibagrus wyckioides]
MQCSKEMVTNAACHTLRETRMGRFSEVIKTHVASRPHTTLQSTPHTWPQETCSKHPVQTAAVYQDFEIWSPPVSPNTTFIIPLFYTPSFSFVLCSKSTRVLSSAELPASATTPSLFTQPGPAYILNVLRYGPARSSKAALPALCMWMLRSAPICSAPAC